MGNLAEGHGSFEQAAAAAERGEATDEAIGEGRIGIEAGAQQEAMQAPGELGACGLGTR
jgi:hypothetical protein